MKWMELKNYLAPSFMKEIDLVSEIYMNLVKELQEGTDEDKKEEYDDLRERRIEELDLFYEINFDLPYISIFENGRIKLKKLLLFAPNNQPVYQANENTKDNNNMAYDNSPNQYNPLPTNSNYNELMQRGMGGSGIRSIKTTPQTTQQNEKILKNPKKAYIAPQVETKQMVLAMKKQMKAHLTTPIQGKSNEMTMNQTSGYNNSHNSNKTQKNQRVSNKSSGFNKNNATSYYNSLRQAPLNNNNNYNNKNHNNGNYSNYNDNPNYNNRNQRQYTYGKDDEIYPDEVGSGFNNQNMNYNMYDDSMMGDNCELSNTNRQNKPNYPNPKGRPNNNNYENITRNNNNKQSYDLYNASLNKTGDSNFSQMDEKEKMNYFKAEAKQLTVSFKLNEAEYRYLMQEKGKHIMRIQHKK